tara:strand:+ start:2899 stop:3402 length:504 start_codon:yes stop_codon:yes gene_type:complete
MQRITDEKKRERTHVAKQEYDSLVETNSDGLDVAQRVARCVAAVKEVELAAGRVWQYAKSMPKFPHCYFIAEWIPADRPDLHRAHQDLGILVNTEGYVRYFYTKAFDYLDLPNGYHYWCAPPKEGEAFTLINRGDSPNRYPHSPSKFMPKPYSAKQEAQMIMKGIIK